MKKTQLIDDLKAKTFIATVSEPKEAHPEIKHDNGKWYSVEVRETVGKAAIYRTIHFYVIDEGTAKEEAYYKDKEPVASIKEEV